MGHGSTGGHLAAPIFANFMRMALAGKPIVSFRMPQGMKLVRVNRKTGERASEGEGDSIIEAFKPNEAPEERKSIFGTDPE
jgi:penicillin-binding protein 1A